jgi:hypothetical protein
LEPRNVSGRAGYAKSFSEFKAKLNAVGFEALDLLPPPAYMDFCYLDYCIMGEGNDTLEKSIHTVLFPPIKFLWVDYVKAHQLAVDAADKNWRNAKCDVLALWCHIRHGGGVFVTSDGNFHAEAKRGRVEALGAGTIATPHHALSLAKGQTE